MLKALKNLKKWFLSNKREFPWRTSPTPYKVWISEIMLQQTKAEVVIPFFHAWIALFPDLTTLAKASTEQVIKAWEGLGYYQRARNLHKGAQYILKHHQGKIPSSQEELEKIPGIGPYTAGAILLFAFHKKAAALDTNIARVLTRFFLVEEDITKEKTKKTLTHLKKSLLFSKDFWVIAEALIELGALICLSKKPVCSSCPLNNRCQAFFKNKATQIPKTKKMHYINKKRMVFLIEHQGSFLLKKGEKGQIMQDLYEFPYIDISQKITNKKQQKEKLFQYFSLHPVSTISLKPVKQSFTRFRVTLFPIHYKILKLQLFSHYQWFSLKNAKNLPFSSGHKKILHFL